MRFVSHGNDGQAVVSLLCRTLYIWAAWVQATTALPQGATEVNGSGGASTAVALIPSAPRFTGLIPSAPSDPESAPSDLISSQLPTSGLIPSQSPPSGLIPSQSSPGLISSQSPPALIPSAPPSVLIPSASPRSDPTPSNPPGLIPTAPGLIPSATEGSPSSNIGSLGPIASGSDVASTPMPSIRSTEEGLRPIPAPTTAPGSPDGHHEISEPNFSVTAPCRGCSPVIEISATGFYDSPVPEHAAPSTPVAQQAGPSQGQTQGPGLGPDPNPTRAGSSQDAGPSVSVVQPQQPPKATITAGLSNIIISQQPSGGNFVVGESTTVTPGQTITVDNTPIVIQTSPGRAEIVVGTAGTATTVSLMPNAPEPPYSQITEGPILAPVTIAGQTVTANAASQFVVSGQTLEAGGPAITVDGTTVSLAPSATAVIINGVTSTISQAYGAIYTTTTAPLLTLNDHVYTANRAGYYVINRGTTLIPGGPPITISGTTISLEPKGTAAIIQGSTSIMAPMTTIVTSTRGYNPGEGSTWTSQGGDLPPLTTGKHNSAPGLRAPASFAAGGWVEGLLMLLFVGSGWLAVWL